MFKFNVKRANQLKGRIAAFNRAVKKYGLSDDYLRTYKEVKAEITSLKEFKREMGYMGRLLRPGAGEIVKNKYGVEMTRWERNEINYALRAANKNRKELKEMARKEARTRQEDFWEPLRVSAGEIKKQSEVAKLLQAYRDMGSPRFIARKQQLLRDNLLKSIEWMEGLPQYQELYNLFTQSDIGDLLKAMSDRYSPTTVNFNYKTEGVTDEELLLVEAEEILSGWKMVLGK